MVLKPSPKPTFAYHLLLSLLLVCSSYAGIITPKTANPIIASTANRNELADYTFSFAPETDMPAGTQVQIEFPGQYRSGLGIPIEPTCSVPCTLSVRTVQFTISSAVSSGTTVTVTIKDIENPEAKGGTGSFKVSTVRGVNVLDENAIFGTIGIANSVSTLGFTNVVLETGGKSSTGETTNYAFSFKVTQVIPAGSYFKFTISDTRFLLDPIPDCSVFAINGKTITGTFTCTTVDRDVFVRGLSADIPALQDVGVKVKMTNPSVAGQTDSFAISVLRGGTNIIYDRRTSIPGVVITPSSLTDVTLAPVDTGALQAKNNIMDYILTYRIKNPLALGSSITMQFPLEFQIDADTPSAHFVKFGLEDPSESSPVVLSIDYDNNIITLSNFKALNASTLISLQVRLQNPAESGVTSAMAIYTYGDAEQTQVIDADTTSAYTTIASVESPTSYSITTQSLTVSTVLSSIEFLFKPSSSVPSNGVIKVRVPSGFTVGTIAGTSCQVKAASGSYASATCTNSAGVLSITLPAGTTFASGTDCYFSLNSLLTSPATNGTYLFDVTSYQSGGTTVIESWTVPLILVAPGFTSNTVSTLCVGAGKTTLLNFVFQPTLIIPAAAVQTTTNDTKGVIEFEFSGVANDLGTGKSTVSVVPCKSISGLTAISGRVNCYLYPGTNPVIRVDNFQQIAAATPIEISFSKISNPSPAPVGNAFSVKIKSYKIQNRIRTDLNTGTVSVSVQTPVTLTESATTASSSYTFTNNVVLGSTSLTFTPGTTTTLTGPGTILVELPYYDNGYIPVPNSLTCKLGSTTVTCLGYSIADWVAITLASAATFTPGTTITIDGLKVPQYSTTLSAGPVFRYIQNSTQQETINRPQQVFPAPTTPTFTTATLSTSNTQNAAVNVDYTFTLVPPNAVPQGSSLVITFPTGYNLLDSNPPVSFSSTTLVPVSSTDGISFTRSYSQVLITSFTTIAAGATINVKISGVKNPSSIITQAIGWTAEIKYLDGTAVSHPNFAQFYFTSSGSVRVLSIGSINIFPLNALQEALYNITFTPQTPIPVYGEIRITFPSLNYKVLPSPPNCRVSGAITTFSQCTLSGSKVIVTLDTAYTTGEICVTISGVKNPSKGTTLPFIVETYYDGQKLDETDSTNTANRKVTLLSAASTITMNSLGFAPKNEGEPATYTFSFLPTTALTSDMMIQVIFPVVYDNNLGSGVTCSVSSGLSGNFLCGVSKRVVSITGFTDYTPDSTKPITISIYNVVNPNRKINDDTKQFKIATLKQGGTSYVDINTHAGSVETLDAPGWAVLWAIDPTNSNARTSADYTFNFSTFDKIPKLSSGGEVRISLPEEFEMNDQDLTCESLVASFASTLTCNIERNNIIINGNTEDYGGNVALIVRGITNPVSAGATTNIQVKVYDDFNAKVVERTYSNLDIFAHSYVYPGPLIYVNDDNALTIERGTQTNDLYITMDYPSALNLSMTPTTPGFSIIPFYIDFPLGAKKAKFRMSVPADFALGTYYVQWTILGELIPPYYTPLRRTKVTIVSNKDKVVNTSNILPIPQNGNSLPNYFTIPNGPTVDLGVSLSFLANYPGITLSTSTVSFRAGQEKASFIVYASSTTAVTSGSVLLTLTGTNADTYQLANTVLPFTVEPAVTAGLQINSVTSTTILANEATFTVSVTNKCMMYYVLALKGTDTPTLDEAVNFGPAPYTSTESRYFSTLISDETVATSITIDRLVAETPYVLFVYVVDRGGFSAGPNTVEFSTANRYNAAEFQLQFTQGTLNSAEKQVAINAVAFLLSLDPSKIQEKKYTTRRLAAVNPDGGNERRFLESSRDSSNRMLATSLVTLQIMAVPDSPLYPSPQTLALSLNSKVTQLSEKLTNFDSTYTITATDFTRYIPSYSGTPTFTAAGTDNANFTGQLSNYGYLFVVCVKLSEDKGTPTPYQVWRGLSSNNVKSPSASVEVSSPNTAFVMKVSELDEGTDYNGYIIGGSAHPGYPDLMIQDNVVKVQFKTNVTPKVTIVKTKSGEIVGTAWSVLVGMLCLLFLM